jgi:hypothetical protein
MPRLSSMGNVSEDPSVHRQVSRDLAEDESMIGVGEDSSGGAVSRISS